MSDYRQQQEIDEQQAYLWHCLCQLKGHISVSLWDQAERELGMADDKTTKRNEHGQARI